jgi:hypothetical protein
VRRYLFHGAGAPPPELVDLFLCRDVYHCLPGELDDQDWRRIQAHRVCLDMEAVIAEHRRKTAEARARGGR